MAYHQFEDEDGSKYGSFEVFQKPCPSITVSDDWYWNWWPCFPGCLPDGDEPTGPFLSEQEAINDAQNR